MGILVRHWPFYRHRGCLLNKEVTQMNTVSHSIWALQIFPRVSAWHRENGTVAQCRWNLTHFPLFDEILKNFISTEMWSWWASKYIFVSNSFVFSQLPLPNQAGELDLPMAVVLKLLAVEWSISSRRQQEKTWGCEGWVNVHIELSEMFAVPYILMEAYRKTAGDYVIKRLLHHLWHRLRRRTQRLPFIS